MEPGIYSDITMAQYLADPCPAPSLSASCALRLITHSPQHAWASHPKLGGAPPDQSEVADIGSVAHDLLLGGEGKIRVIDPAEYPAKNGNIPDGWTNPAIRAARDEARTAGLAPILADKFGRVQEMVAVAKAFLATSEIPDAFKSGQPEQTMIWDEYGVKCRARPDWLCRERGLMLHYKSTMTSARPEPFIRGVMASMGYGFTLQFYARGLWRLTGRLDARNVILVQEQERPYACALIGLTPALAAIEDQRVDAAMRSWSGCIAADSWPAYSGRIHYAEPLPWQLAEAERMGESV